MEEPKALSSVAKFHQTFQHPILEKPAIPNRSRSRLRLSLLSEELEELEKAIEDNDLVEVADALCDLQYVLAGAVLEFGLGNQFKALFDEVQRSNMSKACKNIEEAEATVKHYQELGIPSYFEQRGEVFLVYRTEDRKTLKSVKYSPAQLNKILNQ